MHIGLIPARCGSKGIPNKNLVDLGGRPLLAHTVEAALNSDLDKVFVSSDGQDILDVGKNLGAMCLKRPKNLAGDQSSAIDVLLHAVQIIQEKQPIQTISYLQPTSPFRTSQHINEALNLMRKAEANAVVSVTQIPHNCSPGSISVMRDGELVPYINNVDPLLRQQKPTFYARNGPAILMMDVAYLLEKKALYDGVTLAYIMDQESSIDIDDLFNLKLARVLWDANNGKS